MGDRTVFYWRVLVEQGNWWMMGGNNSFFMILGRYSVGGFVKLY